MTPEYPLTYRLTLAFRDPEEEPLVKVFQRGDTRMHPKKKAEVFAEKHGVCSWKTADDGRLLGYRSFEDQIADSKEDCPVASIVRNFCAREAEKYITAARDLNDLFERIKKTVWLFTSITLEEAEQVRALVELDRIYLHELPIWGPEQPWDEEDWSWDERGRRLVGEDIRHLRLVGPLESVQDRVRVGQVAS